jgi:hypothetical protein
MVQKGMMTMLVEARLARHESRIRTLNLALWEKLPFIAVWHMKNNYTFIQAFLTDIRMHTALPTKSYQKLSPYLDGILDFRWRESSKYTMHLILTSIWQENNPKVEVRNSVYIFS